MDFTERHIRAQVRKILSEAYVYDVYPSKIEPGNFVLKEMWLGFYD